MIQASLDGTQWQVRAGPTVHADAPAALQARPEAGDAPAPESARPRAELPAHVPGCVHADLARAGLLGDVDVDDGELRQAWVGYTDWVFTRTFSVAARLRDERRVDLVFDGLDSVAQVRLNGVLLGTAANQFHPHRFDVRRLLREHDNVLEVAFRAPVGWVREQEAALGPRPVNGDWTPYPFIRKSACSFGWDWGPQAPSCGLCGSVRLEAWSDVRIAEFRPLVTSVDALRATIDVRVRLEFEAPTATPTTGAHPPTQPVHMVDTCSLVVEVRGPEGRSWLGRAAFYGDRASAIVTIDNPERWWPRGLGGQPLYSVRANVVHGTPDEAVDGVRARIGLRSVELDTAADQHGSRFAIKVNGQAVFCTGANWIPAALHPACAPRERTTHLLALACEANLNMLRVWGGGVYESPHFYERCDELGLLVWQDFMFACATYPEDAPYPELIEAEARHQVARLSSHPSVVLWCGGNENVLAWQSWGFRERLAPEQSWGKRYWLDLLPKVCAELDPTRPYWPDSPWSGSIDVHANDPSCGDRHTWDLKVEQYRSIVPRFASEYGHQSPPNMQTLRESMRAGEWCASELPNASDAHESHSSGDSGDATDSPNARAGGDSRADCDECHASWPNLALRQRAGGGNTAQYALPLAEHFAPATTFSEWLYQAHLLQARAMSLAITWHRTHQPRTMGSLFWQWNDVWSGPSWSAVDAKLRPKPVWHAVQRAARTRLVSIEPLASLRVALVNDRNDAWKPWVTVHRLSLNGRVLAKAREQIVLEPHCADTSMDVARLVGEPADPACECIMVEVEDQRAWWMFTRDRDQRAAPAKVQLRVTGARRSWRVDVTAHSLVRDLWVEPLVPWVACEPNLLTLLPGERATIAIELAEPFPTQGSPAPSPSATSAPAHPSPAHVLPLRVHAAGGLDELPRT